MTCTEVEHPHGLRFNRCACLDSSRSRWLWHRHPRPMPPTLAMSSSPHDSRCHNLHPHHHDGGISLARSLRRRGTLTMVCSGSRQGLACPMCTASSWASGCSTTLRSVRRPIGCPDKTGPGGHQRLRWRCFAGGSWRSVRRTTNSCTARHKPPTTALRWASRLCRGPTTPWPT